MFNTCMCCGYGARLHSGQNFFQSPLSKFSGSTPGKDFMFDPPYHYHHYENSFCFALCFNRPFCDPPPPPVPVRISSELPWCGYGYSTYFLRTTQYGVKFILCDSLHSASYRSEQLHIVQTLLHILQMVSTVEQGVQGLGV